MKSLGVFFKKHSFNYDYIELFINEKENIFYVHYKSHKYKVVDNQIINVSKEVYKSFLFENFIGIEEEMVKQKRLLKLKKII